MNHLNYINYLLSVLASVDGFGNHFILLDDTLQESIKELADLYKQRQSTCSSKEKRTFGDPRKMTTYFYLYYTVLCFILYCVIGDNWRYAL